MEIHDDVVAFFLPDKMFRKLSANFNIEQLSWKSWIFWFLGRWNIEFILLEEWETDRRISQFFTFLKSVWYRVRILNDPIENGYAI
jgi:hypothetical protein